MFFFFFFFFFFCALMTYIRNVTKWKTKYRQLLRRKQTTGARRRLMSASAWRRLQSLGCLCRCCRQMERNHRDREGKREN
eukprot:EC786771.1.p2 GENE.EC786771.1~~EC786771.1.p2  ORF type:complete len:80 (-),score=12.42 EC786771.1:239-478(-)